MLAAASADVVAADLRVSRLQDPLPEGQLRPRRISARRTPTSTVQVRRICSPNVEPYPPDGTAAKTSQERPGSCARHVQPEHRRLFGYQRHGVVATRNAGAG